MSHDMIAERLYDKQFAHLSESDKENLILLIANISESSFRRGMCHAYVCDKSKPHTDPELIRFEHSLDSSVTIYGDISCSKNMLWTQYGRQLIRIGFQTKTFVCSNCNNEETVECNHCEGYGTVECDCDDCEECEACEGSGEVSCPECDGEGSMDCPECT